MHTLLSQLRRHRWAQRLRYEAIYSWPGWRDCSAFNVGCWPLDADVANDPASAAEPNQIQLYAELIRTAALTPAGLKDTAVLEIAAGRGGGLAYIKKTFAPAALTGLDISRSAVRHGRARGLDMIAGSAHRLPFPDRQFDLVLSLDALVHLADR
ncbi:MAG TPA: class I SAM-dependent methyltransferase, partial [Bradyrhizobium sp.]|nr:class I SAM-dependent methyltransferase [Bradyrhizobium sp.]